MYSGVFVRNSSKITVTCLPDLIEESFSVTANEGLPIAPIFEGSNE